MMGEEGGRGEKSVKKAGKKGVRRGSFLDITISDSGFLLCCGRESTGWRIMQVLL